jgi:hypothetical protein
MLLSTIVVSEFEVKQPISDLPLRNFLVLPFNIDHAIVCGRLVSRSRRDEGDDRVRVKDDMKLIAQCVGEGASHVLTEDANTLAKYVQRLEPSDRERLRVVHLKDGFDISWFEGGQTRLVD